MESTALLKSKKIMVDMHFDTQHMSSMQHRSIVCSTVDRPAHNCGSMMSRIASKKKFVCLAKANTTLVFKR